MQKKTEIGPTRSDVKLAHQLRAEVSRVLQVPMMNLWPRARLVPQVALEFQTPSLLLSVIITESSKKDFTPRVQWELRIILINRQ